MASRIAVRSALVALQFLSGCGQDAKGESVIVRSRSSPMLDFPGHSYIHVRTTQPYAHPLQEGARGAECLEAHVWVILSEDGGSVVRVLKRELVLSDYKWFFDTSDLSKRAGTHMKEFGFDLRRGEWLVGTDDVERDDAMTKEFLMEWRPRLKEETEGAIVTSGVAEAVETATIEADKAGGPARFMVRIAARWGRRTVSQVHSLDDLDERFPMLQVAGEVGGAASIGLPNTRESLTEHAALAELHASPGLDRRIEAQRSREGISQPEGRSPDEEPTDGVVREDPARLARENEGQQGDERRTPEAQAEAERIAQERKREYEERQRREAAEELRTQEARRKLVVGTYRATTTTTDFIHYRYKRPKGDQLVAGKDIDYTITLNGDGTASIMFRVLDATRGTATGTWRLDEQAPKDIVRLHFTAKGDNPGGKWPQAIPEGGEMRLSADGTRIEGNLFGPSVTGGEAYRVKAEDGTTSPASPPEPTSKPLGAADFVGTYEATAESIGDRKVTFRLDLGKDGTFVSTFRSGTKATQVHRGRWKLGDGVVALEATSVNGIRLKEPKASDVRIDGADLLADDYRLRRTGK